MGEQPAETVVDVGKKIAYLGPKNGGVEYCGDRIARDKTKT